MRLAQARLLGAVHGVDAASEIEQAIDEGEAEFERLDWHAYRAEVSEQRAALAALRGDDERRLELLGRAHELYTEMGATGHAERTARGLEP